MEEMWKDIKGFEGYYQASNLGRIRGLDRYSHTSNGRKIFIKAKILTSFTRKDGHIAISLNKNSVCTTYVISRIIYSTFNPNFQYANQSIIIKHKDGDMTNNGLFNLYQTGRKSNVGNTNNLPKRPVVCITTNKEFISLTEASNYYNIGKGNIANCCKGKLKLAGKLENGEPLVWMYLDEYKKMTKEEINFKLNNVNAKTNRNRNSKPKQVINIITGEKFNTISEASKFYNIEASGISRCCSNEAKYAGNLVDGTKLVWMYLDNYKKVTKKEIEFKIHNNSKIIRKQRRVLCITTGKEFDSILEAGRFYNVNKDSICNCCREKSKSAGKLPDGTRLVWEYLDD